MVINGLRVVDDNPAKLRMSGNMMYVNLFLRYSPFRYKGLGDVATYVRPDDWMYATDETKGYWHLRMHPDTWPYLAFQLDCVLYYFKVLVFGVGPACRLYTAIKQEVYKPMRAAGVRMTVMIDDQLGAAQGRRRAMMQCLAELMISWALGFWRGREKLQLLPAQQRQFLGLLVDALRQRFEVPAAKRDKFVALAAEVLAAPSVSQRTVAVVAEKMMAMGLAIDLAPLLARGVHRAWGGGMAWDQLFPSPAAMLEEIRLFCELLHSANGKPWRKRAEAVMLVGDASDTQMAAFTPGGELEAPIITVSSTARELLAVANTLEVLRQQRPYLLKGRRLVYQTDSHNTFTDIMAMKGGPATFPVVRAVRLAAAQAEVELEVTWRPRTDELAQQADALSKATDSDWELHPEVYEGIMRCAALRGAQPTLDVFASDKNTKVPGAFYSRYLCPGTLGVNAFAHPWAALQGQRQLAYIYGPFGRMGAILERTSRWTASWWGTTGPTAGGKPCLRNCR